MHINRKLASAAFFVAAPTAVPQRERTPFQPGPHSAWDKAVYDKVHEIK